MGLISRTMILVILGTMFLGIAAVNGQGSTTDTSSGSKTFIIWVGDKNSLNLPQAKVYIDENYVGTTDSNGEVRTPISFGTYTISASTACGSASKEYTFSEEIDGASLNINTCPNGVEPSDGSLGGTVLPGSCSIAGKWSWFSGQTAVINNVGTAEVWTKTTLDNTGNWILINAKRQLYVIQWKQYHDYPRPDQGEGYVDLLTLSPDCKKLEGYSLVGTHVTGNRI
jgi:hypothetical protein